MLVLLVLILLYPVVLTTWVYFDARKRGAANPWDYALAPWFEGWLGPFIYLENRKNIGKESDDETESVTESER